MNWLEGFTLSLIIFLSMYRPQGSHSLLPPMVPSLYYLYLCSVIVTFICIKNQAFMVVNLRGTQQIAEIQDNLFKIRISNTFRNKLLPVGFRSIEGSPPMYFINLICHVLPSYGVSL